MLFAAKQTKSGIPTGSEWFMRPLMSGGDDKSNIHRHLQNVLKTSSLPVKAAIALQEENSREKSKAAATTGKKVFNELHLRTFTLLDFLVVVSAPLDDPRKKGDGGGIRMNKSSKGGVTLLKTLFDDPVENLLSVIGVLGLGWARGGWEVWKMWKDEDLAEGLVCVVGGGDEAGESCTADEEEDTEKEYDEIGEEGPGKTGVSSGSDETQSGSDETQSGSSSNDIFSNFRNFMISINAALDPDSLPLYIRIRTRYRSLRKRLIPSIELMWDAPVKLYNSVVGEISTWGKPSLTYEYQLLQDSLLQKKEETKLLESRIRINRSQLEVSADLKFRKKKNGRMTRSQYE